jgi:dTDP-4-dehydrorhamnose 3,5-epimerase
MNIVRTEIPEVVIIEPTIFGDQREVSLESFQSQRYAEIGINRPFLQDNLSRSARGVLRGLHVQSPKAQGKLVTVLRGRVLDVAVDIRKDSPTFGEHAAVELNDDNRRQLWVPRGFAHRFIVLSETADFFYKCDEYYLPESQVVIRWDDAELGIDWGVDRPTVSDRDAAGCRLSDNAALPAYAVN